ncbi:MAG: hypothetical protein LBF57_00795 [Holosporaceae bacterium]|nr:hypothetical protein [Holosporaceae bacterium]
MKIINQLICCCFVLLMLYFGPCSAMLSLQEATKDSSSQILAVEFKNPCYSKNSEIKILSVRNGDPFNFSAHDLVGKGIAYICDKNEIPNPFDVTHSGVATLASPVDVFEIIRKQTPSEENPVQNCTIGEKAGAAMIKEISTYHCKILAMTDYKGFEPFLLEASGDAKAVLAGIYPHVQIHPLALSLKKYVGDVFQRSIYFQIPVEYSLNFIANHIGKSYETLSTANELFNAINDGNSKENTSKLFCSEMVALYLRGAIQTYLPPNDFIKRRLELYKNVSNILPEEISSGAGQKYDIMYGVASPDQIVKHYITECCC